MYQIDNTEKDGDATRVILADKNENTEEINLNSDVVSTNTALEPIITDKMDVGQKKKNPTEFLMPISTERGNYIYVYMYMYINNVYLYLYLYIHIHIYKCNYLYVFVYIYIYIYIHVYVYKCICIYIYSKHERYN
jgi:hypothetical protein